MKNHKEKKKRGYEIGPIHLLGEFIDDAEGKLPKEWKQAKVSGRKNQKGKKSGKAKNSR